MTHEDDNDDAFFTPTLGVTELLEEKYFLAHMESLRLFISLQHLHSQRAVYEHQHGIELDDDDERDTRDEFALELNNLHRLLANEHLKSTEVIEFAYNSIRGYLATWPGAIESMTRWWAPRQDFDTALTADLQMVIPGLWIGSHKTLKPQHQDAITKYGIRHVIRCDAERPNADDDFEFGATWAATRNLDEFMEGYPLIQSDQSVIPTKPYREHSIILKEIGRMEFLVRRREKTLYEGSNLAWTQICEFIHTLWKSLHHPTLPAEPYVDAFDGVLLYCEFGISSSIAVCLAVLMTECWLPYSVALRVVQCARRDVAPTPYLQHCLQQYSDFLVNARRGLEYPVTDQ